jgi:hypothetical protein
MAPQLTPEDTDKLLELQEKCDMCKEVIVREEGAGSRLDMHAICDKCKKVRVRLPELMEVKRKLMAANAKG